METSLTCHGVDVDDIEQGAQSCVSIHLPNTLVRLLRQQLSLSPSSFSGNERPDSISRETFGSEIKGKVVNDCRFVSPQTEKYDDLSFESASDLSSMMPSKYLHSPHPPPIFSPLPLSLL